MGRPRDFSVRDRLITLARFGKITPQQAEAKAAALGLPPFEKQPPVSALDPMREPRWPIVMAVAWIAWRDLDRTRQQSAPFRSECTHWLFQEWNQPVKGGTAFARRAGWFLETWSEPTTVRLSILEKMLQARDELPATKQMSVNDAEQELWRALSEGKLIAEGLDANGKPTDIPTREWPFLELYEDGRRDVLKYDALDRQAPFTRVHLKRDDLMRIWPRVAVYQHADEYSMWTIEAAMIGPLSEQGNSGYVPLCAAVQWIMCDAGARLAVMDQAAWDAAIQKLWPDIATGQIEMIGLPAGQSMPAHMLGHTLAIMKALPPLPISIGELLVGSRSFIQCTPFQNLTDWHGDFNDKLYESGRVAAAWTHLQLKKVDVLSRWPRAAGTTGAEQSCYRWLVSLMRESPSEKANSRDTYWRDAKRQFPSLAMRQFRRAWDKAIAETGATGWSRAGRRPGKSNRHRK